MPKLTQFFFSLKRHDAGDIPHGILTLGNAIRLLHVIARIGVSDSLNKVFRTYWDIRHHIRLVLCSLGITPYARRTKSCTAILLCEWDKILHLEQFYSIQQMEKKEISMHSISNYQSQNPPISALFHVSLFLYKRSLLFIYVSFTDI